MTILFMLDGGGGAGSQAGSVSYVGWWIGGQGAVVASGAKPWLVGRTVTYVAGTMMQ